MKKGFTLIELLAVIAIIAIVALITTPIINNVLANSRENTFKNSVQEIVNIVKMDYNEYGRMGAVTYNFNEDGTLTCEGCIDLEYTGQLKASGSIVVNGSTITLNNFTNDEFIASYNNNKVEVIKKES